jgi:Uma2 family endonuclease
LTWCGNLHTATSKLDNLEYTYNMPRVAPVKTEFTFEDYVRFESTSQVRHEFVDGNLFVMAGGTKRHNALGINLCARLLPVVQAKNCSIYINDVIARVPSGKGYYPDLMITCDSSLDSSRTVLRPSILIEVLSNSTEAIDRGEKWEQYQTIPSLEQYVLLSQNEMVAEIYSRQDTKWIYERIAGAEKLVFSSLGLEIVLAELYQNLPSIEPEDS